MKKENYKIVRDAFGTWAIVKIAINKAVFVCDNLEQARKIFNNKKLFQ